MTCDNDVSISGDLESDRIKGEGSDGPGQVRMDFLGPSDKDGGFNQQILGSNL